MAELLHYKRQAWSGGFCLLTPFQALCKAQPLFITHQVTEGVITNYIKHIRYF